MTSWAPGPIRPGVENKHASFISLRRAQSKLRPSSVEQLVYSPYHTSTPDLSLSMFGDLVELATTVVNPDHSPDIKPHISGASTAKMAGSRRSKSQSVSSTADANGNMPPPITPASALTKPARKPRSRSTTSPPGSPRPVVVVPSKSAQTTSARGIGNYVATLVMSITVEGVLQSLSSQSLGTGELAAISRVPESWFEIVALLVYKIALLSFYWFSGFDGTFPPRCLLYILTDDCSIRCSVADPPHHHSHDYPSFPLLYHQSGHSRLNDRLDDRFSRSPIPHFPIGLSRPPEQNPYIHPAHAQPLHPHRSIHHSRYVHPRHHNLCRPPRTLIRNIPPIFPHHAFHRYPHSRSRSRQ
jgi:hypothetical protein